MKVRLIDGNDLVSLLRTRRAMDSNPASQDAYETALNDAAQAEEITLNTLRDEVYQDAVAHGLWEGKICLCDQTDVVTDEVMELLSASSAVTLAETQGEKKKAKRHFNEELADIVIGCFSLAGKLGIDIDAAVRRKIEFNKTRPWKHGKE